MGGIGVLGGRGVAGGRGVDCNPPTDGVSQAKAVNPIMLASKQEMANGINRFILLAF